MNEKILKYKTTLNNLYELLKDYPFGSMGYDNIKSTICIVEEKIELLKEGYIP